MEVIDGVQGLLHRTLNQTNEQLRILRSCKYKLEKDIGDKLLALDLDQISLGAKEDAIGYVSPTAKTVDPK